MNSAPGIHVRAYAPQDAAAVNRIAVAAYAQYRETFTDWQTAGPRFSATSDHAKVLELLVAEEGDAIRGFVGYVAPGRPRERIFKRPWAVMRMLAVDPPARGRGIGRRLIEECIAHARRDAAPIIGLHTSPVMAAALSLYLRLGFVHHKDVVDRHGIQYAVYTLDLGG